MVCESWWAPDGIGYPWFEKGKKVGRSAKALKKSTNVPNFQRTRNCSHLFIMEDSKSPLPVVDMKQPPLKIKFYLCFTNEKL
jgi:hypothetical protein